MRRKGLSHVDTLDETLCAYSILYNVGGSRAIPVLTVLQDVHGEHSDEHRFDEASIAAHQFR